MNQFEDAPLILVMETTRCTPKTSSRTQTHKSWIRQLKRHAYSHDQSTYTQLMINFDVSVAWSQRRPWWTVRAGSPGSQLPMSLCDRRVNVVSMEGKAWVIYLNNSRTSICCLTNFLKSTRPVGDIGVATSRYVENDDGQVRHRENCKESLMTVILSSHKKIPNPSLATTVD